MTICHYNWIKNFRKIKNHKKKQNYNKLMVLLINKIENELIIKLNNF